MTAAVLIGAICVVVIGVFVGVLRWDQRRDDRKEQAAAEDRAMGAYLKRARYGNTWGAQQIRASLTTVRAVIAAADPDHAPWEPPKTSPAAPPSSSDDVNYTGASPGTTAAAAGDLRPPESPPPLPGHIQLARIAAYAPGSVPFDAWDPTRPGSDDFVEAFNTITGGTP